MTKNYLTRLLQASLMCCLAVIFTACDDMFATEDNPTPAYLSMSTSDVTLKVGESKTRTAIAVSSAVIEYTSDNTAIATVDANGTVTGVAEGETKINAIATGYSTSGKKIFETAKVSYKVIVKPSTVAVTSITLDQTTLNKKVGDAAVTLTATVAPDDATDKTVTWSSDKTAVATVADGVVTFVGAGTATITAEAKDGSGVKAICTVTVLPPGALAGVFSVSDTKKVRFSQGNLRATYDGTNWTWAFAANQYDYIGNAEGNTKVTNSAPFVAGYTGSSTTVDLFGWVGTSSTFTGAAQYGISSSNTIDDYGNSSSDALKGDWGKLAISNGGNTPNSGWRTLTQVEWQYLFDGRTSVATRYCKATVNSIKGLIIFPDNYTHPDGVTAIASANVSGANYTSNTWSLDDWAKMEAAGAVFLPAAGRRYGSTSSVGNAGADGYYWSSSPISDDSAGRCYFDSSSLGVNNYERKYGSSVRLVSDVATE